MANIFARGSCERAPVALLAKCEPIFVAQAPRVGSRAERVSKKEEGATKLLLSKYGNFAYGEYFSPCQRLASGRCSTAKMRTARMLRIRPVREFVAPCKASDTDAARQCCEPMRMLPHTPCRLPTRRQKRTGALACSCSFLVTRTGIEPMFPA